MNEFREFTIKGTQRKEWEGSKTGMDRIMEVKLITLSPKYLSETEGNKLQIILEGRLNNPPIPYPWKNEDCEFVCLISK